MKGKTDIFEKEKERKSELAAERDIGKQKKKKRGGGGSGGMGERKVKEIKKKELDTVVFDPRPGGGLPYIF